MKKITLFCTAFLCLIVAGSFIPQPSSVTGAWKTSDGDNEMVMILHNNYITLAAFNKAGKKFFHTKGGVCSLTNNSLSLLYEFNTENMQRVGASENVTYVLANDRLSTTHNGKKREWTRIDDNKGALAGAWRITGRMQGNQMRAMNAGGPRKTLKILSGTRFQWVAMNTETKQISGTGGGTYTFENGKYTEHIEFFSRDSSRVGASLSFDGSVSNNVWTHKGLSSRGQPIHEEWTKVE